MSPSPSNGDSPLIYLALGFHDHQPVGNFPHVFEEHYQRAYLPFLDTIEPHRNIPFSLHLTGPLLLWMSERHPEYLARLRRLCAAGRVEMKGGGFYEPILAAIPDADKREQLEHLSRYLGETLGSTPEGAWIAERVWEPHLARHLAEAGLQYAPLDDSHFLRAGLAPDDIFGYYVTEEEGHRFDLFPISKELRYLIPFQEPEATISYLRDVSTRWQERLDSGDLPPDTPVPLAVYDDDGEKFGGWPGTHEPVYEAGWLDRFLGVLERETEAGWLQLTTLGEFRRRFPPLGRIYLPTGSYAEMLEWSQGFHRNFLVRYEEANLLHKRMLHTSLAVTRRLRKLSTDAAPQAVKGIGVGVGRPAADALQEERRALLVARDRVHASQCNDVYWHGIFGGIYLPHLRHAAYACLIEAEKTAGDALRPAVEVVDLDLDGSDEVFLRSKALTVLVHPRRGGTIVSLDHLDTSFALLDTFRRRRELEHSALESLATGAGDDPASTDEGGVGYGAVETTAQSIHDQVRMKEPGLERMLFVDAYPRAAFTDHFYAVGTDVTELIEGTAVELGDFARSAYEITSVDEGDEGPTVIMRRTGSVAGREVSVRKAISLDRGERDTDGVTVSYVISVADPGTTGAGDVKAAPGHLPAVALFAPEINLTLLAGWARDRYVLVDDAPVSAAFLADNGTHPDASSVTLVDESEGLRLRLSWRFGARQSPGDAAPAAGARGAQTGSRDRGPTETGRVTLLRHGVITVSLSEDGFERIYQSTALVPCALVPLDPAVELRVDLRLDVTGP